ncbi:MAG: winged helix-turn-helix domain-containing protein [Candidatus Bathyarchaeia archaeon]
MSPSKLEKYLSILEVLVSKPLKFENIAFKANIECSSLKRCLNFLIVHKLVEERRLNKKRVVYAITQRGATVFKTFEAQKYFQKIKAVLSTIEEESKAEPLPLRHSGELKKKNQKV